MIRGVGIDIIEKQRFQTLSNKREFLDQVLTEKEMSRVIHSRQSVAMAAMLFSLKEALFKALGCGLHYGSFWRDIEVDRYCNIRLFRFMRQRAREKSVSKVHRSCVHSKKYAITFVILE